LRQQDGVEEMGSGGLYSRKEFPMEKRVEDEVVYYYDSHPTEEDLMGETSFHSSLAGYLTLVLRWLFQGQLCAIYENLNFYQTPDPNEYPLAPDIAVVKGAAFQDVRSWRVGKTGPAPQGVLEIVSAETWKKDLFEKPIKYAQMGVQEYFAYDPHVPPLAKATARRLFGWRLDETQVMRELLLEPGGRLWSIQLDSFLIPDGKYLRLYDRYGQLRLTEAEAAARQAEVEARRAEAAVRQAEIEARRVRALAEKLRSLGIDPDQLV
jgi:Uma2 family endonuclease